MLPVASRPSVLQDASALVSIQAFMGDTRFKEEAQKKELQDLVNHVERECGDARAIKEFANLVKSVWVMWLSLGDTGGIPASGVFSDKN